jgi:hypothetical protein
LTTQCPSQVIAQNSFHVAFGVEAWLQIGLLDQLGYLNFRKVREQIARKSAALRVAVNKVVGDGTVIDLPTLHSMRGKPLN